MAKGYWGPASTSCICCSSGPKSKFLCEDCLHVCKAPNNGSPHCPTCQTEMRNMGQGWRPAKKNKRSLPPFLPYQLGFPGRGQELLEKIMKKGSLA